MHALGSNNWCGGQGRGISQQSPTLLSRIPFVFVPRRNRLALRICDSDITGQ
jgi:hypothetical protein